MFYDIVYEIFKKDNNSSEYKLHSRKTNNKISIGDIPLITGSIWDTGDFYYKNRKHGCPYDKKGYFIVNGSEKIIIPQARMGNNLVIVSRKTVGVQKTLLVAEVRSLAENDYCNPSVILLKFRTSKERKYEETFKIKFPYSSNDINLAIVFKALGIQSEKEIFEFIQQGSSDDRFHHAILPTIEDAMIISGQREALIYIAKKVKKSGFTDKDDEEVIIQYAVHVLNNDLYPHMGKDRSDFRKKAIYLGYVAYKTLLVHFGLSMPDNRDHQANKRYELVGPLLEELYRDMMESMKKDIQSLLTRWLKENKPIPEIASLFKKKNITLKFNYFLGTGNWTTNTSKRTNKTGVSAPLQRVSYASAVSHLRRINTPIGREGKLSKPRQLDWSQFGKIDPSETPDGGNVGLVNNFALTTHVSMGDSSFHLTDIIMKSDLKTLEKCTVEDFLHFRVFVNGKWIGVTKNAINLIHKLRRMKRSLDINPETSIAIKINERSIFINTDAGRCMRPLLNVKNGKLCLTRKRIDGLRGERYRDSFLALMSEGLAELVDILEEDNCLIAMFPKDLLRDDKYTHMELHPCTIYGEIAGSIPYLSHNPGPRTTFQSGK